MHDALNMHDALAPDRSFQREAVEAWLLEYLQRQLGVRLEHIDGKSDAASLGLDSLEIEQMIGALEDHLGRAIDIGAVLRCANIRQFVDYLVEGRLPDAIGERDDVAVAVELLNPYLARRMRHMRTDKTFARGEGCYLEDEQGRRYLDFVAGYGALPFGHNPEELWQAVSAMRATGEPNLTQLSFNAAASELACKLNTLLPDPLRYVTLGNSGAEAVEAAIKLCRLASGRRGILSTHNSFHGKTLGALSATGNPYYQLGSGAPVADFEQVPYGDLDALSERLRASESYFAAFIVEPIQGEGGVVVPPPGYLKRAAELCRRHRVLVVMDEVQTGLGRTGAPFAFQTEGLLPDVLLLAKALGGGLVPIAACISSADVFNEHFALRHSSTFAGNTLACRVALAALDKLSRDDWALVKSAKRHGDYLRTRLLALAERFPDTLAEVRGRGLMLGVRLSGGSVRDERSILDLLFEQGLAAPLVSSLLLNSESVRVVPTLNDSNVLRIQPPLTVSRADCDIFLAALERSLQLLASADVRGLAQVLLHGDATQDRVGAIRGPAAASSPRVANRPKPIRFGFLIHPLTHADYRNFDAFSRDLSAGDLAQVSEIVGDVLSPFVLDELEVGSRDGTTARGVLVVVPRTAEQLLAAPERESARVVEQAVALCVAEGAKLVGLGGYTSVITRGGESLRGAGCGLTTGNAYTAIVAQQAVDAVLRARRRGWETLSAAVVGGGGSVGRTLAALCAERCGRLLLVGNPNRSEALTGQRLREAAIDIVRHLAEASGGELGKPGSLREQVLAMAAAQRERTPEQLDHGAIVEQLQHSGSLVLTPHAQAAVPFADVVMVSTSAPDLLFGAGDFRAGAVICDVSRPPNVPAEMLAHRSDVTLLEGGLVRLPAAGGLQHLALGERTTYACMAETMLLALAGCCENFSMGSSISIAQVRQLRRLAADFGFEVCDHLTRSNAPGEGLGAGV